MRTVLSISFTQIVLAVILNCSKPVAPMYSKEETMELTQSQSCLLQDTGGLTTIEYTNRKATIATFNMLLALIMPCYLLNALKRMRELESGSSTGASLYAVAPVV